MSNHRLILGIIIITLLAGCKIIITVPANGRVDSQSGDNNCAAGKQCMVNVIDLFFDDTFTGVGADGFKFKQWKKRERGLCGGKSQACRVYTSLLSGNPLLEAFLDSDEMFYLEPVFEPSSGSGGGAVGQQNSSVCFNEAIFMTGNTFTLNYRSVDKAFGTVTDSKIVQTVVGPSNFKGKQATLAQADITVTAPQQVVSRSDSFFQPDIAAKRSTDLGGTGETYVDGVLSGGVELENTPGRVTRYDLAAGESFAQTYTTKAVQNNAGMQFSSSQTQTLTTKYIGVVLINIIAGTYQACKFEERITGMAQGFPMENFRTYWTGVGIGLQLKEDSEATSTELVSGSIDGKAI